METPRTDEFEHADCCALDFARELECELAQVTAERDALKAELANYTRGYVSADQHNKLAAELHTLKQKGKQT
jgi:hypothetical protein